MVCSGIVPHEAMLRTVDQLQISFRDVCRDSSTRPVEIDMVRNVHAYSQLNISPLVWH